MMIAADIKAVPQAQDLAATPSSLQPSPAELPAAAAVLEEVQPTAVPPRGGQPSDWFLRNVDGIRTLLLAMVSLSLFVLCRHLLTENRVNMHIRFANIPSPSKVLASAETAANSKQFATNVSVSCRRILMGFSLAALLAVPLGLLMGRYRLLRDLVFPITEVIRPVPAIAWVPMSIMLWPTNEESIVFITFLGSFFPILLNTLAGMASVDPVLVRAAQSLGAKNTTIFREVYFPASLPHIFTGLAVGMGVAWVSLIAAEMISGQFGIGYYTWEAYSLVQYADIALGMITIGILGLISSASVRLAGHLAMPWKRAQQSK
jgi:NitT/TauT family transport system permease protein